MIARRADRLSLLATLRTASCCAPGSELRQQLDEALFAIARLPLAEAIVLEVGLQSISAGGTDTCQLLLNRLASDATTSYSLAAEVDNRLVLLLPSLLRAYLTDWLSTAIAAHSDAHSAAAPAPATAAPQLPGTFTASLVELPDLDRSRFQPSGEWTATTWQLALPKSQASRVALSTDEHQVLDADMWPTIVASLDRAGINAWQFVSWLNSRLPFPTTLLPIAALCVERRRLIQELKPELRAGAWKHLADPHVLEQLQSRLPARIALMMAHGSATRTELRGHALNDATVRHRFTGAMYRELSVMHGVHAQFFFHLLTSPLSDRQPSLPMCPPSSPRING